MLLHIAYGWVPYSSSCTSGGDGSWSSLSMCSLVFRTQQTVMLSSPDSLGSIFISLVCPSPAADLRSALGWVEPPHLEVPWNYSPSLTLGQQIVRTDHWGWVGGSLQNPSLLSQRRADSKVEFVFQSSLWDGVKDRLHLKPSFVLSFCLIFILLLPCMFLLRALPA